MTHNVLTFFNYEYSRTFWYIIRDFLTFKTIFWHFWTLNLGQFADIFRHLPVIFETGSFFWHFWRFSENCWHFSDIFRPDSFFRHPWARVVSEISRHLSDICKYLSGIFGHLFDIFRSGLLPQNFYTRPIIRMTYV